MSLVKQQDFTADFFRANRTNLRKHFTGTAPIVVAANGLLQRNADSTFPFRQDSSFWYLTGIDDPDVILVIDKSKEYLIVPAQTDYQKAFDGKIEYSDLATRSGIETIFDDKNGWKLLSASLKKTKGVCTLTAPAEYIELYGMYTNPARRFLIEKMHSISSNLNVYDIRDLMTTLRCVKQPLEIDTLRTAINLTIDGIMTIANNLHSLEYEYEIEAGIVNHFLKAGAESAWKPIVASGKNATVLHYLANRSKLKPGELVYLDVGAEVMHYTADITRTYSIGGELSKRQRDVMNAVQEVQDYAFGMIKPGLLLKEYEKQIENFMGEKLRELGLIKTVSKNTVRRYYPHATSHFLGLDAHDVGNYDQPLEQNMVITVEPGIYIPEEGIGIRIEDDILITADGYENLSKALAR